MARQSATFRLLPALALVAACGGASPVATVIPTASPSVAPISASPPATGSAVPSPSVAVSASATVAPTQLATPSAGLPGELAWSALTVPDGPGPREDQTWTVDPTAGVAYMFGGRADGDPLDELWRYDLAADSWRQLEPPSPHPEARFGHVAAWDPSAGLLIWSGQQSPEKFFNDLWTYDPQANAWTQLPADGDLPAARYGSCGGIAADGTFWISHGFTMDSGRFHDTRAYDFTQGRWFDRTPDSSTPVDRCLHDCFWTASAGLLLYGGQTTGVKALGDLWSFDPATRSWTQQAGAPLPARQLYALATLGNRAYFFGGGDIDGGYLGDMWQLDIDSLGWSELRPAGASPPARSGATLIDDAAGSRLLLFGGKDDSGEFGDLWQLAGQ